MLAPCDFNKRRKLPANLADNVFICDARPVGIKIIVDKPGVQIYAFIPPSTPATPVLLHITYLFNYAYTILSDGSYAWPTIKLYNHDNRHIIIDRATPIPSPAQIYNYLNNFR